MTDELCAELAARAQAQLRVSDVRAPAGRGHPANLDGGYPGRAGVTDEPCAACSWRRASSCG